MTEPSFMQKLKRIQEVKRRQLEQLHRASQSESNADRSLASTSMTFQANRTAPAGTKYLDSSHVQPPAPPSRPCSVARPPRPVSQSRRLDNGDIMEIARSREPKSERAIDANIRRRSQSAHCDSEKIPATPISEKLAMSVPSLHDKIIIKGKSFLKIKLLGKGGSCKVYDVMDENTHEQYAIKVVDLGEEEEQRNAYLNEIKLLEELQGTSHVILMHDYELRESENLLYVILEKGDTDFSTYLRSRLKEESIDSSFIRFYWKEMLKCVKAIHDKKIVHSDLKPANFLLVKGHLKLIDFGIASSIPKNQTSVLKDCQMGTLSYMAPEALNFGNTDRCKYKLPLKSDVWSLGCILYNMVYGILPFNHIKNQNMKMAAITNPSYQIQFDDCADDDLMDTLKRCLERDVDKRLSVDQLLSHSYLTGSRNIVPSSPVPTDLLQFVSELKENTPNTAIRKLKSLVLKEKKAVLEDANQPKPPVLCFDE